MLDNCNYSKIRILHDLSKVVWFIDNHAKNDAAKAQHEDCIKMYAELQQDLEKHIDNIKQTIENLSKQSKFV